MSNNDYWRPTYSNASRPDLLSDGSGVQTFEVSTMKDEFKVPKIDHAPKGRKKELLRKFFWDEFAKKYMEALSKPELSETEPPDSNYRENFNARGFKVRDNLLEDYTDAERRELEDATAIPLNTYYFMLNQLKAQRTSHNPYTVFRQTSTFSKPWYAPLE